MTSFTDEEISQHAIIKYDDKHDTPPYSPVQVGKVCVLSVLENGIFTFLDRELRIRPWENSLSQKWRIETQDGRFAFRNLHSGTLLGLHVSGNLTASVRKINEWELFTLDPMEGGYRFTVPNFWLWSKHYLVRPSLADYLKASEDIGYSTAIDIQYIDS